MNTFLATCVLLRMQVIDIAVRRRYLISYYRRLFMLLYRWATSQSWQDRSWTCYKHPPRKFLLWAFFYISNVSGVYVVHSKIFCLVALVLWDSNSFSWAGDIRLQLLGRQLWLLLCVSYIDYTIHLYLGKSRVSFITS